MMGRSKRRWGSTLVIALALASGCLHASQANAATGEPLTEADLERAFQAVLADPADLAAAFEYARIAAALGDYEGAISSLERMLMFNPDLVQVQVELGVLYFRLGSYEAAQSYLNQALAHDDLPPDAKERIETFQAEIQRQASPNQFAFSFTGGLRYQSNANLAPGNTILSGGSPTALPIEFAETDDFAVFAGIRMRHHYDFGTADGDFMETNAGAYTSQQFQVDDFDLTYLDVDTGPQIILPGAGGLSVRPYVKASALFIEEQYYQGVVGGGANLNLPLSPTWSLGLDGFWQYASYTSSADRPTAEDLDGQEIRLAAEIAYHTDGGGIALIGEAASINASANYEAYDELSARVFAWKDLPAPFDIAAQGKSWTITLAAEFLNRSYDAANPLVSPDVRNDNEYRIDGQLIIPVTMSASAFVGAGWHDVRSNLPNYTFDNITALGGFNVRF